MKQELVAVVKTFESKHPAIVSDFQESLANQNHAAIKYLYSITVTAAFLLLREEFTIMQTELHKYNINL